MTITHPATPNPKIHESEGRMILPTKKSNMRTAKSRLSHGAVSVGQLPPPNNYYDSPHKRNAWCSRAESPVSG
jgi:hypothetical protein